MIALPAWACAASSCVLDLVCACAPARHLLPVRDSVGLGQGCSTSDSSFCQSTIHPSYTAYYCSVLCALISSELLLLLLLSSSSRQGECTGRERGQASERT